MGFQAQFLGPNGFFQSNGVIWRAVQSMVQLIVGMRHAAIGQGIGIGPIVDIGIDDIGVMALVNIDFTGFLSRRYALLGPQPE